MLAYGGDGRAAIPSIKNMQLVDCCRAGRGGATAIATGSLASQQAACDPARSSDGTAPGTGRETSLGTCAAPQPARQRFQMGKLADDVFSVDWRWPLTPMAAFGLALAICDTPSISSVLRRRMKALRRLSQASSNPPAPP